MHLTRNVALETDPTVVQTPGVPVTKNEQELANTGLLEYTFQVEFKLKNNVSEIGMFQEFVRRIVSVEPNIKFLPWNGDDDSLPKIDGKHLPYATIRGQGRLKHYLGA